MFLNPDIVQVYFNWSHNGFSIIDFLFGVELLIAGLIISGLLTRYGLIHESDLNKQTNQIDDKKGEKDDEN
jgi:hypothetical protein